MVYCGKEDICANCPDIPGSSACEDCRVQEICEEAGHCDECPLYETEDEGEDYD